MPSPLTQDLADAQAEISALKKSLARQLQIAAEERRLRALAEESVKRAYKVAASVPVRPDVPAKPLHAARLCARDGCGARFEPARSTQKFCSNHCLRLDMQRKSRAARKRERPALRHCARAACGSIFQPLRRDQKFCGGRCRFLAWQTAAGAAR